MRKGRERGAPQKARPFDDRAPYLDWFRTVGSSLPASVAGNTLFAERPIETSAFQPARPVTVILAVIDDGIAFAHERFRQAAFTSRIEAIWLQDALEPEARDTRVPFGRELSRSQIDDLLRKHAEAGLVDEDALYRDPQVGLESVPDGPFRLGGPQGRFAHGTLTLDLLAGADPGGSDLPILAVQLPREVTIDTSGTLTPGFAARAREWIEKRAEMFGSGVPVVVCFSYGTYAGPHDGTSTIETTLEERPADRPMHLVMPAGNSYLARTHACLDGPGAVTWRLQPDDRTASFVEIWPTKGPVEVSLQAPRSLQLGMARNRAGTDYRLPGQERPCARVYAPDASGRIVVAAAPTEALLGDGPPSAGASLAPSGDWTIRIDRAAAPVHLWIQRDDAVLGPGGGRQSYFPEPDDAYRYDGDGRPVERASTVTRYDTINAMATGAGTTTVAGYRRSDGRIAAYSSCGPKAGSPATSMPDLAAPSEDGVVHAGILGAGARSGSAIALRGTSFAAPQVGRWIAEHLTRDVLAEAEADERTWPPKAVVDTLDVSPELHRGRTGRGRLVVREPCARWRSHRREADGD